MITHDEKPEGTGEVCVLDGQNLVSAITRVLATYDATAHVGIRTTVHDAAVERVDEDGEETIELPKPQELRAAAAMVRCLTPIKLRGSEIKAMRKIMRMTLSELAKSLDERTAPETLSRWETEAQPMGGYAEKLLRLFVCERLRKEAPGVEYNGGMIANLKVRDPWRADADYELPPIILKLIHLKQKTGTIIETWNEQKMAA